MKYYHRNYFFLLTAQMCIRDSACRSAIDNRFSSNVQYQNGVVLLCAGHVVHWFHLLNVELDVVAIFTVADHVISMIRLLFAIDLFDVFNDFLFCFSKNRNNTRESFHNFNNFLISLRFNILITIICYTQNNIRCVVLLQPIGIIVHIYLYNKMDICIVSLKLILLIFKLLSIINNNNNNSYYY